MVLYEIYREDGGNGITFVYMLYMTCYYTGYENSRYCIDTLHMNDPFDLLQDTYSLASGDIKRNRDVNILLQGFRSKKTELEMFTANKIYGNTGPEMIFFGFKKKIMKSTKIRAAIPSNKTSIWCGLTLIFFFFFSIIYLSFWFVFFSYFLGSN